MNSTNPFKKITEIEREDHLCWLYETDEEHRAVLTPFLRRGLELGEKVLCFVNSYSPELILGYLQDDGVEVDLYLDSGQLKIIKAEEAPTHNGVLDPNEMIALLQSQTEQALAEGYSALRVTGEMTWALSELPGSDRLIEYETMLNKFCLDNKCSAICQYDRRRFDPGVLLDVLTKHPIAVVGKGVFDNIYYMSPEDSSGHDPVAAKLEHWVDSLVERKQAEDDWHESEEKYRDLVENLNEVVYATDLKGRITELSPVLESLVGYNPSEFIGRNLSDFFCQEELPHITKQFQESLKGHFQSSDYRVLTKSGEFRWVRTSIRPILEENRVTELRGTLTDITESKLMKSQLQQSQKMDAIGTLAGGIAHDFNNILAGIIGFTEIALLDVPDSDPIRRNLEQALKASNRARELVRQIFVFSRHDDYDKKPLKITPIIKETLKLLRSSIPSTIDIRQKIKTTNEIVVLANLTQIHQILIHLCTNGARAMGENGGVLDVDLVNVDLDSDAVASYPDLNPGSYVKLTVRDNGHGMDRDVIERIFDPSITAKEMGQAPGKGLSVIHGIMKGYGGTISVSSEPGKGTTFDVFFPRIENEEELEPGDSDPLPMGKGRILFVDDEAVLVQVGKQMLEHLGYEVVARTSSIEALEAFCAKPKKFDLVITDQTMPNMTGTRLTKELLNIRPEIPIILCTGYSEAISPKTAKTLGIKKIVTKPIALRELAETIRDVLKGKEEK